MKIEYEVKILEIDIEEIKNKLKKLGAEFLGEEIQKRYVYDFNPINPNKWIRLRQKGKKVELTIKEISDDSITGTREIETSVGDFETTNSILEELGYKAKAYQENKRISYKLNGVEIELDFWPQIPVYMEIEGKNEEEVEKIVNKLGYKMSDTTSINTTKVYEKYGLNIKNIKILKFNK